MMNNRYSVRVSLFEDIMSQGHYIVFVGLFLDQFFQIPAIQITEISLDTTIF